MLRSVAENPAMTGSASTDACSDSTGSGLITGRCGIVVGRRRSARAELIAALVSVARNGSSDSRGALGRCTGTIGVMPGGGGGGAETGRLLGTGGL